MKKRIIFLTILVLLLLPTLTVLSDPNWGPIDPWISYKVPSSGLHIVSDPLVADADLPYFNTDPGDPGPPLPVYGWVNFVCSALTIDPEYNGHAKPQVKGFDYKIEANGLSAGTNYVVKAYALPDSDDFGSNYTIGNAVANGKGTIKVSGFIDLDPGFYDWQITVELLDGTTILTTLPAFTYLDPINWDVPVPFPGAPSLYIILFGTGDTIDFLVDS